MAGPSSAVPGFRFSGIHCGIKAKQKDLALIVSDAPASAAAVFTRSSVVGAPVEVSRQRIRSGMARAVIVNSGVSNVAMGERGIRDALRMTRLAGGALGCDAEEVLVASTGVIGEPLPMAAIARGVKSAAANLSATGLGDAAEAIRTTDTFAKIASRRLVLGGRSITLAGIAKGSGMIEPDMATMLAFLMTDATASPAFLRGVLRRVSDDTFNRVTVDGETSTSDSVFLLANGAAEAPKLRVRGDPDAERFEEALHGIAESLARDLARDGEGATRLVTVRIEGARNAAEARAAARRVANSMLVKTAIFGGDPNWGRILQTIGAERIRLDLARTRIRLCGITVFRNGAPSGAAARRRAEAKLAAAEVEIAVDLGVGRHSARMWTCDLSGEYVRINAEYTT
jgi:glutamate N-acetyltransferase/amino-acid N-acetyltransferase